MAAEERGNSETLADPSELAIEQLREAVVADANIPESIRISLLTDLAGSEGGDFGALVRALASLTSPDETIST